MKPDDKEKAANTPKIENECWEVDGVMNLENSKIRNDNACSVCDVASRPQSNIFTIIVSNVTLMVDNLPC